MHSPLSYSLVSIECLPTLERALAWQFVFENGFLIHLSVYVRRQHIGMTSVYCEICMPVFHCI